jgi:hypothetical protein
MSERLLVIDNYTLRVSVCPLCSREALTTGEAYKDPDVRVPPNMEWSSCWSCKATGVHPAGMPQNLRASAYLEAIEEGMCYWGQFKESIPKWFHYLLPNLAPHSRNLEDMLFLSYHSMLLKNYTGYLDITAKDHERPGWGAHSYIFREVCRRVAEGDGPFTVPFRKRYLSMVSSPLTCKLFGSPWIIPSKLYRTPASCGNPRDYGSPHNRYFPTSRAPGQPYGKRLHMAFPLQSWPGRENGFLNLICRFERRNESPFERGRFSCIILTDTEGRSQRLEEYTQKLWVYLYVPEVPTDEILEFDNILQALESPELMQSWMALLPPTKIIRAPALFANYNGPMPAQVEEPELPPTR